MELKLDNGITSAYPFRRFNRTFMELKLNYARQEQYYNVF